MERDAAVAGEPSAVLDGPEAFAAWVRPHWTVMAHFATRLVGAVDSEDVLQDALAVAWRKRGRFDERRGPARSWLLALVADQARKAHRRTARRPRLVESSDPGGPSAEQRVDIERAVARLSPRQRIAVYLYYYLDLPVAEVAAVMGCAEGTAKSTLADARGRLHDYLEEGSHE